jgi:hypothetical protein
MQSMRRLLPSALLLCLSAGTAMARAEKTLAYQRDQVWAPVVRFVRVDEQLKIVEKDAEAGYVMFELHEEKRTFRGSIEIATVIAEGRTYTKLVIVVNDRPEYVEIGMLKRLEHKLYVELGSPAPEPSPKQPDPRPADPPPSDAPRPRPIPQDPDAPKVSPTP